MSRTHAVVFKPQKVPEFSPQEYKTDYEYAYAYKKDGCCVAILGKGHDYYNLIPETPYSQRTELSLEKWIKEVFGASDLTPQINPIGEAMQCIWRPGITDRTSLSAILNINPQQKRSAEQALYILLQKVSDLLLYIEPNGTGLKTYSHKTRELLLLACMEVENGWRRYSRLGGWPDMLKTTDYHDLAQPLYLSEYGVRLRSNAHSDFLLPFLGWEKKESTKSIPWYHSYNKTKHDRDQNFHEASFIRSIEAVAAAIVMFSVQYGPHNLHSSTNMLSSLFNELFEIKLFNAKPETFYVPEINMQRTGTSLRLDNQLKDILPCHTKAPKILRISGAETQYKKSVRRDIAE